ncbi:MAG: PPC domain-containing DNA-binding protein [Anaeromassilibacillus sp.]
MQYRVFGDTYVVRLQRGEEVLACLRELCEKESISLGTVSAIGAVNHVVVGVYRVDEQKYVANTFDGVMELTSLMGNITEKDGEPYLHLHATFGDLTGKVIGGHLNEAVVSATCELFVRKVGGPCRAQVGPGDGAEYL